MLLFAAATRCCPWTRASAVSRAVSGGERSPLRENREAVRAAAELPASSDAYRRAFTCPITTVRRRAPTPTRTAICPLLKDCPEGGEGPRSVAALPASLRTDPRPKHVHAGIHGQSSARALRRAPRVPADVQ
jgi:hypothetical protein